MLKRKCTEDKCDVTIFTAQAAFEKITGTPPKGRPATAEPEQTPQKATPLSHGEGGEAETSEAGLARRAQLLRYATPVDFMGTEDGSYKDGEACDLSINRPWTFGYYREPSVGLQTYLYMQVNSNAPILNGGERGGSLHCLGLVDSIEYDREQSQIVEGSKLCVVSKASLMSITCVPNPSNYMNPRCISYSSRFP